MDKIDNFNRFFVSINYVSVNVIRVDFRKTTFPASPLSRLPPMNSFDRFSRRYSAPSESPFRRDVSSAVLPEVVSPPTRRVDSALSVAAPRSVYRLSRDANADESCVSVADVSLPTPLEPPRSFPVSLRSTGRADVSPSSFGLAGLTLPQIERLAFLETLVACNGCRRLAARKLGVSEKTMYNKIKQYKLAAELKNLESNVPKAPIFN